jgi:hypothetical protein
MAHENKGPLNLSSVLTNEQVQRQHSTPAPPSLLQFDLGHPGKGPCVKGLVPRCYWEVVEKWGLVEEF